MARCAPESFSKVTRSHTELRPPSFVLITLLTDFGTADYFVGAMKGVIFSRAPDTVIVDLSHEVPAHDIEAAAYLLLCVYADFPPGTVHTVVVDPGVGSERAAVVAQIGDQIFIGPDNGVFSYVVDREGGGEFRRITHKGLIPDRVSPTFHGRDLFAPVAAALADGFPLADVGPIIQDPVRLPELRAQREAGGLLVGRILHVDKFGNLVTNFRREDLPDAPHHLTIGDVTIRRTVPFYEAGPEDRPVMIWGSAGFLEISLVRASAAEALGVTRGAGVRIEPDS